MQFIKKKGSTKEKARASFEDYERIEKRGFCPDFKMVALQDTVSEFFKLFNPVRDELGSWLILKDCAPRQSLLG